MTAVSPAADLRAAVGVLATARSVTVLCHIQPDADTIGSGLALAMVLRRRNIPVRVAFAEPAELPGALRSLPGTELLVPADQVPQRVDLLVTVDCGSTGRLGALADRLPGAETVLVLDHHVSNTRFGTLNVIDTGADSTTSVVAAILREWGEPLDRDIAHCLYAGLVTDTGCFRWGGPDSHRLADELLATGIDGRGITRELMDTHPFGWLSMLSRVLGAAKLVPEAGHGRGLVYTFVHRDDRIDLGSEEVESIIDIIRTTGEAAVAAVFKEARGIAGLWSVSLRSRDSAVGASDGIDVAAVAAGLGGGGHKFAAGYTTRGTEAELVAALLAGLDRV